MMMASRTAAVSISLRLAACNRPVLVHVRRQQIQSSVRSARTLVHNGLQKAHLGILAPLTEGKMAPYTGHCYCSEIQFEFNCDPEEARTSICHCGNCKRFFGTPFGVTTRIPRSAFKVTHGTPKVHEADNGSGVVLHREFCGNCGSGILEYGAFPWVAANAKDKVYVMYGTIDDKAAFPPKGEFFCSRRESWMPEIPDTFQKQKITT